MDIKCISSGSKGNAYLISDGRSKILLDCGVRFKRIQEACGFHTSDIAACLITHEHKDHCSGIKDLLRRGIAVVATCGTIEAIGEQIHHPYIKIAKTGKFEEIGTFKITSFDTQHDAAEPCGFLIYSTATKEKLVYITDSYYCKYKFEGLTDIIIECNYDAETFKDTNDPVALKKRVMRSHMSLDTCVEFLKANNLKKVDTIHLCHLSDRNSDEARMKKKVAEATGKRIVIF